MRKMSRDSELSLEPDRKVREVTFICTLGTVTPVHLFLSLLFSFIVSVSY